MTTPIAHPYAKVSGLALALSWSFGLSACTCSGPSPAVDAQKVNQTSETSILKVPAPPPPDAGKVDLAITGDLDVEAHGRGVTCTEDDGAGRFIWIGSADVVGRDARPVWHLNVGSQQRSGKPVATVTLVRGDTRYTREIDLSSGGEFVLTTNGAQLDVDLATSDGKGKVHVKGNVTCPSKGKNQVPKEVIDLFAKVSSQPVRLFSTFDFGREKEPRAISVITSSDKSLTLVREMRKRLGAGWVVFIGTTNWLGDETPQGVEVVIGPGANQFDILRLSRSDAVNYGMGTEALIAKLSSYDARFGIDIFQAETDTIQFDLRKRPKDLIAFATELYALCPDIVDQGVGSVDALADAIRKTGGVYLWWD